MLELTTDWKKVNLGDEITMELKPLSTPKYHQLLAFLMPFMGNEKKDKVDHKKIIVDERLPGVMASMVLDSVRNIEGVIIDGKVPTPEEFINDSRLMTHSIILLTEFMTISILTKEESKN